MKALEGKAWLCSACNKAYPHNDHGERMADACCLCRSCKTRPALYVATSQALCRECFDKKELVSAVTAYDHAKKHLERLQRKS